MNFKFWFNYSDESSGIDTYLAELSLCQLGMSALENSSDLVKTLEEMVHLGIFENIQPKQEIVCCSWCIISLSRTSNSLRDFVFEYDKMYQKEMKPT